MNSYTPLPLMLLLTRLFLRVTADKLQMGEISMMPEGLVRYRPTLS